MISMDFFKGVAKWIIDKLHKFWKGIVGWIDKAAKKIEEVLGVDVRGVNTFIQKCSSGILKNISKHYSVNKTTGEWEEDVFTKPVLVEDVPPEILGKLRSAAFDEEISTTNELECQLTV